MTFSSDKTLMMPSVEELMKVKKLLDGECRSLEEIPVSPKSEFPPFFEKPNRVPEGNEG